MMPSYSGSGFLIRYRDRVFLVSAYHVIKVDVNQMFIELGKTDSDEAEVRQVGGFYSFAPFSIDDLKDSEGLGKKKENPTTYLDITFAEIQLPFPVKQEFINWRSFQVPAGQKYILDMDSSVEPSTNETYALAGYIDQRVRGKLVWSRPTYKGGIRDHHNKDEFHLFLSPETNLIPMTIMDTAELLSSMKTVIWWQLPALHTEGPILLPAFLYKN